MPSGVYSRNFGGLNYVLLLGDNKELLPILPKPDCFLISPPYNIGSKSSKKITNRKHGGYDSKSFGGITSYSDNLPEEDYQRSQVEMLDACGEKLNKDGCIVYNHKNRYRNGRMICPFEWIRKTNLELVNQFTWDKKSTHENGRGHPRMVEEILYVLTRRGFNPYYAPRHNRNMKNPTTILRINRQSENQHDAAFPIDLAKQVIDLYSKTGDLVCDIYSGSGTTMCAAVLLGRGFVGCEISPKHFDNSVKRFEKTMQGGIHDGEDRRRIPGFKEEVK